MQDDEHGVLTELRRQTRLLAVLATKDMKQKDQVLFLSDMGFKPKEVAELVGTTANTVSVTLARFKKPLRPAPTEPSSRDGEQGI
jgi:DNA-directed RNA polymerase specialized sigma24 family protein